jgi:hypothetical protein
MKKIISPLLLTLLAIGLFSSCAKKSSNPPPAAPVSAISATLGVTKWTAATTSVNKSSTVITIKGTKPDGTYLKVTIPPNASTGSTYNLPSSGIEDFEYFDTNVAWLASLGSINVTTFNTSTNVMSGTFQGTLTDPSNGSNTIKVTGGTFTAVF